VNHRTGSETRRRILSDSTVTPMHAGARRTGERTLQAFLPLAPGLSAHDWRIRNSKNEVPDVTPYGLHKMERYGVVPEFAERTFSRPFDFLSRLARRSSGGLNIVEALSDARYRYHTSFDVVLSYDEWNGIPATLARSSAFPRVVMGVHFLGERAQTPHVLRVAASMAIPRAAAIFTHTSTMADILKSEWGVPSDRLTVVPFGIDTDFYEIQSQPDIPGVVVSAGEDVLRDHALLIDAVSRVKQKNRNVWLELATGMKADVGPGLGRVHKERLYGRMRDLYQRASVVAVAVHPTDSRASGSTVVLEGMASGRPVVATANPALSEFVKDGVTGILVPPGDVDAMADAIAGLLADPDRAAEMGKAAAMDVRQRFTTDIMARGLAELALSVVPGRTPAAIGGPS
jgi:glycosyltransferase involved in cell wall biosynthesis